MGSIGFGGWVGFRGLVKLGWVRFDLVGLGWVRLGLGIGFEGWVALGSGVEFGWVRSRWVQGLVSIGFD